MGEYIQQHSRTLTLGAIGAAVLVAAFFVWRSTTAPAGVPLASQQAFYSDDDGASYFVDSADKLPPFPRNDKTVYRAAVFTCDTEKTRFVGYLERYPDEARKQLQAARDAAASGAKQLPRPSMAMTAVEVKKPGPGNPWVRRNSREGAAVMEVTCPPSSGGGTPEPVTP